MSTRTVRVDIPQQAEESLQLGSDVIARHTALGGSSPLNNSAVNMTTFAATHQFASDKRTEGINSHALGEAAIQAADTALGIAILQTIDTPNTVYYYTGRIRTQLLLAYQGLEEEISTFGFNVVVSGSGSKKSVRIDIPKTNRPDMEKLAESIITRHATLGANSPLNNAEVTNMETKLQLTIVKRKEGNKYHEQAEAAMQASNKALGFDKGQTINTEGTLYYMLNRIRSILLLAYQGVEEEISTFGFNVVISEAGTGGVPTPPAPQATITLATNQTNPTPVNIALLGGDGEQVTADYGNNTSETKQVNSSTYTLFSILYIIAGNYVIKLMGNAAAFLEIFLPDAKITAINLPEGINISALDLLNNLLTSFFLPLSCINMINLQLNNNALDQQSVNQILLQLAANGKSNGMVNLAGGTNAAPSGQGIAAMNQLIARGWNVITN